MFGSFGEMSAVFTKPVTGSARIAFGNFVLTAIMRAGVAYRPLLVAGFPTAPSDRGLWTRGADPRRGYAFRAGLCACRTAPTRARCRADVRPAFRVAGHSSRSTSSG